MTFTPEFEELVGEIYRDICSKDLVRGDHFLEALESLRISLELDPSDGEFFSYDSFGDPIHGISLSGFDCQVLFQPSPIKCMIWIEGYP